MVKGMGNGKRTEGGLGGFVGGTWRGGGGGGGGGGRGE